MRVASCFEDGHHRLSWHLDSSRGWRAGQVVDIEDLQEDYKEYFSSLVIPHKKAIFAYIFDARYSLVTVVLAGFGRAISEVGAVMIVGGNIDHYTRVMTTAISLETRMGNLEYAMALGIVLIFLTMIIYSLVYMFNLRKR